MDRVEVADNVDGVANRLCELVVHASNQAEGRLDSVMRGLLYTELNLS